MAKKKQGKLKQEKKPESFVEEATGSATMINLDGQWDNALIEHEEA